MKIVTFSLSSVLLIGSIVGIAVHHSVHTTEAGSTRRVSRTSTHANEMKKLSGEWKVVDWRYHGGRRFTGGIGRRYVFKNDRLTVHRGRSKVEQRITIRTDRTPKNLDMINDEFSITRPAIYKIENGNLIICQGSIQASVNVNKKGEATLKYDTSRPRAFEPRGKWNLITLKRMR